MFKRTLLSSSIAVAIALPNLVIAETQVTGYLQNRTAVFTQSGQKTGEAASMLDTTGHDSGDLMRFENSARFFVNGDLGETSTWHADVNLIYDSEGANSEYKGHKSYTQYDWLRELYMDTKLAGWDMRLGKQQVVWGTADGIKLLDIINPTDFRFLMQDPMEDSRIPIWMLNAERNIGDGGNIQFIVSKIEENKIPGLNAGGDSGHQFLLKGVDSITGGVNGFLNVSPALANVAQSFNFAAQGGAFAATGVPTTMGLVPFTTLTVDSFSQTPVDAVSTPGAIFFPGQPGYNVANASPGYFSLNGIAQVGLTQSLTDPFANAYVTNLMPVTGTGPTDVGWNPMNPSSAFEYMPNATFSTFNTFAGAGARYVKDYPDDADANLGTRFKGNTDGGLNYSVNYFYHYDANPFVDLSWHDSVTGEELTVTRAPQAAGFMPNPAAGLTVDQVPNAIVSNGLGQATNSATVLLSNSAGQFYGPIDPTTAAANANTNTPELRFTEQLNRIHSIGASFDYALDTAFAPIVLRGEFLYNKDEMQPIVDKRLLAIGDLSNALTMQKADMFKYVLGAEVNVLTNMLVSAQFIQFRNLDFESTQRTCTTQMGVTFDCSRYTGDMATLQMGNGLKKGYENKEFVSFFISKPFGPSDEHRFNNIIIWEEGDGYWNRFDVEYTFRDELIGTFAWNQYWGDEDTQFGQFDKSSNVQVGVKWIWD